MININKIKIDTLIHSIGLKYNLPDSEVREIVESQFEFTLEKMKELDLSTLETPEDLSPLKTTFLYKTLGKLYINPVAFENYLLKLKRRK